MLEEVRFVARLQAFEDFANELSGNCLRISPSLAVQEIHAMRDIW